MEDGEEEEGKDLDTNTDLLFYSSSSFTNHYFVFPFPALNN